MIWISEFTENLSEQAAFTRTAWGKSLTKMVRYWASLVKKIYVT